MNHLYIQANKLKATGRKGLMTHMVLGHEKTAQTLQTAKIIESCGAHFMELQVPFTDPVADGPTIQHACEVSLARGTTVRDALMLTSLISNAVAMPTLLVTYFNIVHRFGVDRFCKHAKAAGVSGIIVPDAPLEAAMHEGLIASCLRHDLLYVPVIAPASTNRRLTLNAPYATGLAYCMSRQGITGPQLGLDPELQNYLTRVKELITVPVAVGFGIAGPSRLKAVLPHCDIAVVGSAIVNLVEHSTEKEKVSRLQNLLTPLSTIVNEYQ